jgi:hypothetical protein
MKFRRHSNNKAYRQIKRGKSVKLIERLQRELIFSHETNPQTKTPRHQETSLNV